MKYLPPFISAVPTQLMAPCRHSAVFQSANQSAGGIMDLKCDLCICIQFIFDLQVCIERIGIACQQAGIRWEELVRYGLNSQQGIDDRTDLGFIVAPVVIKDPACRIDDHIARYSTTAELAPQFTASVVYDGIAGTQSGPLRTGIAIEIIPKRDDP